MSTQTPAPESSLNKLTDPTLLLAWAMLFWSLAKGALFIRVLGGNAVHRMAESIAGDGSESPFRHAAAAC
jgi:hypothetical protein